MVFWKILHFFPSWRDDPIWGAYFSNRLVQPPSSKSWCLLYQQAQRFCSSTTFLWFMIQDSSPHRPVRDFLPCSTRAEMLGKVLSYDQEYPETNIVPENVDGWKSLFFKSNPLLLPPTKSAPISNIQTQWNPMEIWKSPSLGAISSPKKSSPNGSCSTPAPLGAAGSAVQRDAGSEGFPTRWGNDRPSSLISVVGL